MRNAHHCMKNMWVSDLAAMLAVGESTSVKFRHEIGIVHHMQVTKHTKLRGSTMALKPMIDILNRIISDQLKEIISSRLFKN